MTVLESSIKLLEFFNKNDVFSVEENFKEIFLISISPQKDKATLLAGLKELENQKLLSYSVVGKKEFWVLLKPLSHYFQNISIGTSTAIAAADFINSYCNSVKNTQDLSNPLQITEKDIQNILIISKEICNQLKLVKEKVDSGEN